MSHTISTPSVAGSEASSESSIIVGASAQEFHEAIDALEASIHRYEVILLGGVLPEPFTNLPDYRAVTLLLLRINVRRAHRMWDARNADDLSSSESVAIPDRLEAVDGLLDPVFRAGEHEVARLLAAMNAVGEALERQQDPTHIQDARREVSRQNPPESYLRCVDDIGAGPRGLPCVGCFDEFTDSEATLTHIAREEGGARCNRTFHKTCLDSWWLQRTGTYPWRATTCPFCRGVLFAATPGAEVEVVMGELPE